VQFPLTGPGNLGDAAGPLLQVSHVDAFHDLAAASPHSERQ
jgi:hypothetical protein